MVSTYNSSLTTPKDQARFWIGDTVEGDWLFDDTEITFVLTINSNPIQAAYLLCRQLATKYARVPTVSINWKTVEGGKLSEAFDKRADKLKILLSEAATEATASMPYVAGLSRDEETQDSQDPDLPTPVFGVVGHGPPGGWPAWTDEEWLP